MSLFDYIRQGRTLIATAWLAITRRGPDALPAPTDAQIVRQPRGTLWCGPAAATTVERVLTGRPGALSVAMLRTPAGIMGTWRGNQTSTEALATWLPRRGLRMGILPAVPVAGLFDAVRLAAQGGAYCLLLIYSDGSRVAPAGGQPTTHFVVAYGVAGDRLLLADSIDRGGLGRYEGHLWSIAREDVPRWAVQVTRFGEFAVCLVVRRA